MGSTALLKGGEEKRKGRLTPLGLDPKSRCQGRTSGLSQLLLLLEHSPLFREKRELGQSQCIQRRHHGRVGSAHVFWIKPTPQSLLPKMVRWELWKATLCLCFPAQELCTYSGWTGFCDQFSSVRQGQWQPVAVMIYNMDTSPTRYRMETHQFTSY